MRRKTILNAIAKAYTVRGKDEIGLCLRRSGIDPRRRAETLTLKDFVKISQAINYKEGV
jgi:16S rRNA A1518/A1519 N6-dimethyltransferase RsmA/KsgA/DIM1 with predicted DNA glycosylase/AP lyase activity